MKKLIKKYVEKLIHSSTSNVVAHPGLVSKANVDLFISTLIKDLEYKDKLNDPELFVSFLRQSFSPYRLNVREIKNSQNCTDKDKALRFTRLIEAFGSSVAPLPTPMALEIARVADTYTGNDIYESSWGADVGWHFRVSSSFAEKGRMINSLVRFMRPEKCLEAGTAYGMSALFILCSLEKYSKEGSLASLEAMNPQYSLSSALLSERFGQKVKPHMGLTEDSLSHIAEDAGPIDFFIHDAAHTKEAYIGDFDRVLNHLAPGSVVLIDDIRWQDPRFIGTNANCYEGWLTISKHERVCKAVEIGSQVGLLQLA